MEKFKRKEQDKADINKKKKFKGVFKFKSFEEADQWMKSLAMRKYLEKRLKKT